MRRLLVITPLFVVLFVAGRFLVPESDRILFGRGAVVASLVLAGIAGSWVGFGFEAGGGLLAWPWSFFLASSVAWLITDAQFAVSAERADPWIVCSAALTLSAALAQRRILSDTEAVA